MIEPTLEDMDPKRGLAEMSREDLEECAAHYRGLMNKLAFHAGPGYMRVSRTVLVRDVVRTLLSDKDVLDRIPYGVMEKIREQVRGNSSTRIAALNREGNEARQEKEGESREFDRLKAQRDAIEAKQVDEICRQVFQELDISPPSPPTVEGLKKVLRGEGCS